MACAIKIGRFWHIQWNDHGRVRRITSKIPHQGKRKPCNAVESLVAKYQLIESDLYHGTQRPSAPVPTQAAILDYLTDLKNRYQLGDISARTVENAEHRLPKLLTMLREQGIQFLHDATRERCQRAMVAWRNRYQASTLEHFAHLLSATWNLKRKALKLNIDNPWHQKGVLVKVEKKARAVLTNEDWQIIRQELETAHPWVRFCCTVSHYTGARLMAVANLRENDFNLTTHELTLAESKGKRHVHPCCSQLSKLLLDWPLHEHRYLPLVDQARLSARISEFFGKLRKKYPGKFVGISHHSFRRTYITRANMLGLPKQWSMDLVGHVREETHDIYRQRVSDILKSADQKIADSWETVH